VALWFAVLLVVGVAGRAAAVKDRPLCGYLENDDATAHVLVTCLAFQETAASVHHYLPIFTLGRPGDKGIDNLPGATVADAGGNHYYTSFPPLAFVAAYLGTGAAVGLTPTPHAVRVLALGTHLTLVVVSVGVFYRMLAEVTADRAARFLGAVVGGGVLWTAPEALLSYTVSFWAQHLYQVVFAAQLWCLTSRRVGPGFALLCAVGCLTEWTAFVVNAGVVGLGLAGWLVARDRRFAAAAGWAAAGTLVGGVGLVAWFASVVPVGDYLAALAGRFQLRRGAPDDLLWDLIRGYAASAGGFLAVPVLLALQFRRPLLDAAGYDGRLRWLATTGASLLFARYPRTTVVVALTACSLAENVLCMQHAVVYTYDRIKFVYLLAVLAALFVGGCRSRTLAAGLLVVGTVSLARFVIDARDRDPIETCWRHLDAHHGSLAARVAAEGEPVFMPRPVRGSKVYYARRNIIELPDGGDTPRPVDDYLNDVRHRARGSRTALVVLTRDEIPRAAADCRLAFPRPAELYRIEIETGVVTRLPPLQ
jgi:hypothetical protein